MEYRYNTQGSINKTAFPKTIMIIRSVIINLSRNVFNKDNTFLVIVWLVAIINSDIDTGVTQAK